MGEFERPLWFADGLT